MTCFNNVVLVKAEADFYDVSFFEANIPLCYLSAVIKNHVNSVTMPIDMRIDLNPLKKFENHLIKMKKEGRKCDLVGIFNVFSSILVKAVQVHTFNYKNIIKYFIIGVKYLPKKLYELIGEEISIFNHENLISANYDKQKNNFSNTVKKILYKILMFPFTAVVPVGW